MGVNLRSGSCFIKMINTHAMPMSWSPHVLAASGLQLRPIQQQSEQWQRQRQRHQVRNAPGALPTISNNFSSRQSYYPAPGPHRCFFAMPARQGRRGSRPRSSHGSGRQSGNQPNSWTSQASSQPGLSQQAAGNGQQQQQAGTNCFLHMCAQHIKL